AILIMMKLLIVVTLLLLAFSYSAISYVRFYHYIGNADLKSPYINQSTILNNSTGDGFIKYVALGDSLSAGVGSNTIENTFPYQYAQNLLNKYENENVDLINLAQSGATTDDVINNQIQKTIDEQPDFITLLIGINDIHNKRTIDDFNKKYQLIINELLTKTNAKIIIINLPYLGSNQIVYPPFNFLLNFRTKQFNSEISNIVNNYSGNSRISFADLYNSTYSISKDDPKYYSSDLFHPSENGYLIWSKIINYRELTHAVCCNARFVSYSSYPATLRSGYFARIINAN
ncbi:hypothetical protein CO178_00900, partial [candidate division WWE3 bacterium CG_4_9_14_3_um_filter_34_6]